MREPYEENREDNAVSEREQWAEDHGYMHGTCTVHGGFWTDSGDGCPRCEPEQAEEECEECGHALSLHGDQYGCEHERGDSWVTGRDGTQCLMAQGPCGCKWRPEEECGLVKQLTDEQDMLQRALGAYWLLQATREYAAEDMFLIDALKRNGVL